MLTVRRFSTAVYYNRKTLGPHSRQIFTGFGELARLGAIDLELIDEDWNPDHGTQNLIKVVVDGRTNVVFDTNDGFYWIHGTIDQNVDYFADRVLPKFQYIFKRSCNRELIAKFGAASSKFQPLGLNYDLTSRDNPIDRVAYSWGDRIRKRIKKSDILCNLLGKTPDSLFCFDNFEHLPLPNQEGSPPQILLLTRLWDPVADNRGPADLRVREAAAHEMESINRVRMECIEACRDAFSSHFTGGLAASGYAQKVAPQLIASDTLTSKRSFMALVKMSPICVATTGLHLSTGWRMGEYVAASRAIVSEKIHDDLPGSFQSPRNYLEFSTAEELLKAIRKLNDDRPLLSEMMWNNYCYYRSYGRPDSLVLNALLKALR